MELQGTLGIDIGLRNLAICVLHRNTNTAAYAIQDWQLIDVMQCCGMGERKCTQLTSAQIHDMAEYALPKLFPLTYLTTNKIYHVAIEQQPCGKYSNQRIILFSHLVYHYFRRLLCQQGWRESTLTTVAFASAALKYNQNWLQKYHVPKPKTYIQRKEASVQLCKAIRLDAGIPVMLTKLKQDDLADAFLLAFATWERWIT